MLKSPIAMLALTTALLSLPGLASAHASWIGQHGGDFVVVHGEGSATNEAYDPTIVTEPKGFDKTGAPVAVALAPQAKVMGLGVPEGVAVVSVLYSDGWWTEDAKGEWRNEPADAYPDFKGTGQYFTYPVAYIAATDTQKPVGHKLEIVPLADPTKLAMGDKLEVQVLLDGNPVKGVAVTNDVLTDWDISSTVTDDEGKALVTIANNGLNVLQYYHEVQISEKEIAGHQAVLSFVAHGPEEEE